MKTIKPLRSICIALAFIAGLAGQLPGVTYYVDFEAGSNSASGLSPQTPWKHSPGDKNGTGGPAGRVLAAGDTILFKGGTRYEGFIEVKQSGDSNNPIVFNGSPENWGDGKAIIDGSVRFVNRWTRCTSATEAGGNSNWAQIWYADKAFPEQTFWNTLIISNTFLPFAQDFTPERPIFWDSVHYGWSILQTSGNVTTTTMRDVGRFTQADPQYYNGAWIAAWVQGNAVMQAPITGFNPELDTINYSLGSASFYETVKYSILNNIRDINYAGEYAVLNSKIYMWPSENVDPNNLDIRVAKLGVGFWIQGQQNVTINGFNIQGSYSAPGAGYGAHAVVLSGSGGPFGGITISNCEIALHRSMDQGPLIYALGTRDLVVKNNRLRASLRSRGMIVSGDKITVSSNTLEEIGGTGIYCAGVSNSLIEANRITDIRGIHGNGISLYQGSRDSIVSKNRIDKCGSPITYERSSNLSFLNNLVDSTYGSIDEWGGMTGYVHWFNNTFTGYWPGGGVHIRFWDQASGATYKISNNIFHDPPPTDYPGFTYNLHCTAPPTGWRGSIGVKYHTKLEEIFVNPSAQDWRLRANSPAIGAGENLSAFGATIDIENNDRSLPSDLGAYEFDPNAPPSAPLGLRRR